MSDARPCSYHGEILRDGRDFIAVDDEEFRVIIRVNQAVIRVSQGDVVIRLTLSHAEASELCRHLRNCKP